MFFTYLRRELRRRRKQSFIVSAGLAVGIGLVITVTALASGVSAAQSTVLHSLYGVGTDITVTQSVSAPSDGGNGFRFGGPPSGQTGGTQKLSRDRLMSSPGQETLTTDKVKKVSSLDGVASAAGDLTLTDTRFTGQIPRINGSSGSGQSGQPPTSGSAGGASSGSSGSSFHIASFTVEGVDLGATDVGPLTSTTVSSGRTLRASDAAQTTAVLDSAYATQKSLKVGSHLVIAGTKFTVVGIVTSSSSSSTSGANVYISLHEAQELSDLSGKVNTIYVKAASSGQVSAVKSEIQKALPKTTVSTSSDLASQVSGSLSSASSLANDLGKWLAIAVLAMTFILASLFTVSAVSRRVGEFGTLRAIGWKKRRVVGQVMGESLSQGLLGGVIGIGLGYAGAALITAFAPTLTASVAGGSTGGGPGGIGGGPPGFSAAPGQGATGFQGALDTVDVALKAAVSGNMILLAIVLAIAGGLVAGTFGGWRAARMRPASALRAIG